MRLRLALSSFYTLVVHTIRGRSGPTLTSGTPPLSRREETYSLAGWPRSAPAREREVEVGGLRLRSGNGPPRSAQVSFSSSPSGFPLLHRPARALRPTSDRSLPFPRSSPHALAAHCWHGSPPERPAEEILIRFLCMHNIFFIFIFFSGVKFAIWGRCDLEFRNVVLRAFPRVDFATWDFARKAKKKGNGKMETALAPRATH